jgi:sensor domain CHASE-containing protein
MKQCKKTIRTIIAIAIVCILTQAVSQVGLLHYSFQTIEKYLVQKDLLLCVNSLQAELKHLDDLVFGWSAWDDTALFIGGKKENYIRENLTDDALQKQNLNVFCILDTQGKPVWSRYIEILGNKQRAIDLSMFSEEALRKNPVLWNHKDPNSCISGYYSTEGGVLMLSSRPVTSNSNTGPVHGTVIMGRFITDPFIASITRQACLKFSWWNLRSDYTKQIMGGYISRVTEQNPVFIEFENNAIAGYVVLPGIQKKKAILLKILLADELAPYKSRLMAISIAIYFIEGVLFLACLTIIFNKQCKAYDVQTEQAVGTSDITACSAFEQADNPQDDAAQIPVSCEKYT